MLETALEITIDEFLPLFNYEFGDYFLLITSPEIRSFIKVNPASSEDYKLIEFTWLGKQSRQELTSKLYEFNQNGLYCSVLWITTDEYEHFQDFEITNIKVSAISLFSSQLSTLAIEKIIDITKSTNYQLQIKTESRILDLLDSADRIWFNCLEYDTKACFYHHESDHWFSLHGPLEFGQQTVLPTGELSVLTEPSGQFSKYSRFSLEGQLLLQGFPVVHRSHSEVSLSETLAQFERLSSMRDFPVIASVSQGEIRHLHSPVEGDNPFLVELEDLFLRDESYRKIHEIGFGTHPNCAQLVYENFLPNERYPGIHFGLGLGGATAFHIDLVCPMIKIFMETKTSGFLQNLYSIIY